MAFLCSLLLLLSAFLLFSIQPMVAKMLLPILGGSPSVWNTAMVFYQAALLGGYFYSHMIAKKLTFKNQLIVHGVVLALPAIVLPLYYGDLHPPAGANPVPWMLITMALSVGLPFFVLSTSSPLIQSWFSRAGNKDPYFLYAASNAGSFLGLLSYPFLIEPRFTVAQQSGFWTVGYLLLVVLFVMTTLKLRGKILEHQAADTSEPEAEEKLPWARRLKWVFLAFVPSSQFIGVTTYLTTDIAVMPLLWVIPLAIYLLTMVFVFAKRPPIPHKVIVAIFPFALVALLFITSIRVTSEKSFLYAFTNHQGPAFGTHLVMLFISAMLCHGELAKDRPTPQKLTEFFLWMSFGGVLGGMFNALVAPSLFVQVIEYTLILVISGLAMPARVKGWTASLLRLDFAMPVAVVGGVFLLFLWQERGGGTLSRQDYVPLFTGLACLGALLCAARPLRFAIAVAGIALIAVHNNQTIRKTIYAGRSFFGVNRVESLGSEETGFTHSLLNGRILHGKQIFKNGLEQTPLTYYHPDGPLGEVFGGWPRPAGAKIGIVGLGVGTTAAWAREGEDWTFYEIDELVEKLARDPKLFTYLKNAKSPPKVLIGDARLRLREAPDNGYDILAIDAFSSDSIPAHLMTVEAFQLYRQKLKPDGLLAVHISNRYLNLEPLVAAIGEEMGLQVIIRSEGPRSKPGNSASQFGAWTALVASASTPNEKQAKDAMLKIFGIPGEGHTNSTWCVLAPKAIDLSYFKKASSWHNAKTAKGISAWTDDYSSLLPVMEIR